MLPYLLLTFVPLLFSFLSFSSSFTEYNGKWKVMIGKRKEVLEHSCLIPSFFIILILILALRNVSIGRDLVNYRQYFISHLSVDWRYVIEYEKEDVLYWLLNWLICQFTDDYQVFLTIIALITVLPISVIYGKDRRHGFLKLMIFINMSNFVMLFSGLRQSIAISIGLIAFEFVKKKQLFRFLLMALIAWGFHHSAFVVFAFYPLYRIKFKRRSLWFVIPGLFLLFVFNQQIFLWASGILFRLFGENYASSISETGAYAILILFALLAVFSYVIPDENLMDEEMLGLRNFLLMALLLQCFAPIHMLAMRMNYYFIIFIPILIPKLLTVASAKYKDIAWIAKIVLAGFFMVYYLITLYVGCKTGISSLDVYPYVPYWK